MKKKRVLFPWWMKLWLYVALIDTWLVLALTNIALRLDSGWPIHDALLHAILVPIGWTLVTLGAFATGILASLAWNRFKTWLAFTPLID